MEDESTYLPKFQNSGSERLQKSSDADGQQRVLLERLREICREEMMDVMKTLVDSGHVSPALEGKLNSVQESSKALQEDIRQVASLSRAALWKAVILSFLVAVLLSAGSIAALKYIGGMSIMSEDDVRNEQAMTVKKTQLEAEIKTLTENRAKIGKEIEALSSRQSSLQSDILKSTEAQRTIATNLGSLEKQFQRLQQLQEQFRFKLVQGEDGGAFVEIPKDAKTFEYNEKTYIKVK